MSQQGCPSESEILGLAEGRLRDEDRDRVLAHLDGCDECRRLVAAVAPDDAPIPRASAPGSSSEADRGLVPGQVVANRYRIDRPLGRGGMGAVFEAHHVGIDKRVALKVVRRDMALDDEAVSRLLREAKAAAALGSEHVVGVLDAGRLDETGDAFVVYEHLEGEDLSALLARRGTLEVTEAVDLVLGAAEALALAHARGIVHRDIKPANLFVTERPDGTPLLKVLDFGIAKVGWSDGTETSRRAILGSPRYMAPEQLRSSATVDARADVWSLGVTLFELVAGRAPFQGDSVLELCAAIATEEAPRLGPLLSGRVDVEIAGALETAVGSCLVKDPASRCPDIATLAARLAPLASDEGRASARRVARIHERSRSSPPTAADGAPRSAPSSAGDLASATTLAATAGTSPEDARAPHGSRRRVAIAAAAVAAVVIAAIAIVPRSSPDGGGRPRASSAPSPSADATVAPAPSALSSDTAPPVAASAAVERLVSPPAESESPSATASRPSSLPRADPRARGESARPASSSASIKGSATPRATATTKPTTGSPFDQEGLSDRH